MNIKVDSISYKYLILLGLVTYLWILRCDERYPLSLNIFPHSGQEALKKKCNYFKAQPLL